MAEFIARVSTLEFIALLATLNIVRYFAIAGFVYWAVWKGNFNPRGWEPHNPRGFVAKNIAQEVKLSCMTLMTFPLTAALVLKIKPEWFRVYFDFNEHGLLWYVLSFGVALALHDTWFYWVHRLIHAPALFKKLHARHHEFIYPSPFAGLSLDYGEAVIHTLFTPFLAMIVPIHIDVLIAYSVVIALTSIYGHIGFDIFSARTRQWWPMRLFFLHPADHGNHHKKVRGNYALYFRAWDVMMGTAIGDIEMPAKSARGPRSE